MTNSMMDRLAVPASVCAGALLIASSVTLGPALFFDSSSFSEVAGTRTHVAYYALQLVALIVLAFALLGASSRLAGRLGRLGVVAVVVALVGTILNAATVWSQVFVVPMLANDAPAVLDDSADGMLMVGMMGSWLVFMLGWVLFGIAVARGTSVAAGVLLVLGSLIVPVVGPMSGVVFGAALVWLGMKLRRRDGRSSIAVAAAT